MRNPNGYGSVYKLSGKRRRPFAASITTGYDALTGKQQRIILGYYTNRKDALEALANYHSSDIIKTDMTLAQIYADWSGKKYSQLSKQAVQGYQAAWLKYAELAPAPIINIRTAQLQMVIDNNAELSLSSLQKVKTLAGQLFKYALQNDIVQKNYAQFIELSSKNIPVAEKQIFTELQLQKIEKLAQQELADKRPLHFDSILILCYTGFRISKFLQLTNPFSLIHNEVNQIITLQGGLKTEVAKTLLCRSIQRFSHTQTV